jgi:hypothetical protein
MAKKQGTLDPSADQARQQQKQDKKLAKREAKAMLEVDVARQKLASAEKKLARAQLRLEVRRTRLQAAEAHLADLRNSHQPAGASETMEGAGASDETATLAEADEREHGSSSMLSSYGATQAEATASQDAEEAATYAGSSSASGESEAGTDEELLPEDTLPASEAEVDTAAAGETGETGEIGESEQTEQVPWWKRMTGNHGHPEE